MSGTVYVSGIFRSAEEAAVSVFDRGLLYGDGVFEGMRAYSGRVFKLERHLERLLDSAKAVRIDLPWSPTEIKLAVLETCRRNDISDGYIRVIVTRGKGDLGIDPRACPRPELLVIAQPSLALYPQPSQGIRVITSTFRRAAPDTVSPSIKSLNYMNNVLARIEANDRDADEAFMLDANGYVAEATADNVFIVTSRALVTPPTATNLSGITRETVLEIAQSLAIHCEERFFNLFEAWTAREVFICGTGAEIVPVRSVDGRTIGHGGIGPTTARIIAQYTSLVRSTGTSISDDSSAC